MKFSPVDAIPSSLLQLWRDEMASYYVDARGRMICDEEDTYKGNRAIPPERHNRFGATILVIRA